MAGGLGLYADPYDRSGRLAMDMFISCRLVVDTGMNGLGWSLALGSRFSLPAYHDALLADGMLPMGLVGERVAAWVQAVRRAPVR